MRLFAGPSAVVASGLARRNVQDGRGIIDGDFDDTHGAGEEGREIQYNDSTRLLDPKGYRKRNRTARTERRTRARRKRLFFRAVSAYVSGVVPYSRKWMDGCISALYYKQPAVRLVPACFIRGGQPALANAEIVSPWGRVRLCGWMTQRSAHLANQRVSAASTNSPIAR